MIGWVDEVVVDCLEPLALARFWADVLGGEPGVRDDDWVYLDPPGWSRLAFQRVPEAKAGKNRLHLDVAVDDLADATEQARRAGAQAVGGLVAHDAGSFHVRRGRRLA